MIIHNIGIDISTYLGGGSQPAPVVNPPTLTLNVTGITAGAQSVSGVVVSDADWEITGAGITTVTGTSADSAVTISIDANTAQTSRTLAITVSNSGGSDSASLWQDGVRDIHATFAFVANNPSKVYDEYDLTAVTDATYTIDDGTQSYTDNQLVFDTDCVHTLHFKSYDNHTWRRMFSGCTELTSVVFDGSVHELYANTCRTCRPGLTAVTMTGVTVIGTSAFEGCGYLNILDGSPQYNNKLHEGVVEIGNKAFSNTSLSGTLTIPKTVTTIGASAFTQQYNCTTLNFETGRTEVCTFGNYAFNSCYSLQTLNLAPELDLSSGTNLFRNCTGLTAVTGYSVPTNHPHETNTRAIRGSCFQGCPNLVSFNPGEGFAQINIPDGIEKIGPSAFSGCTSIYSVDLPATLVNNVGYAAALDVKAPFAGTPVNKIISRSATEPPVQASSFTGMSATGVLYTPAGADYTNWLTYLGAGWTQDNIANLPCDVEVTYTGDSNTIHIMGPTGVTSVGAISVDGVFYEPTEYFTFTGTGRTVKFYNVQAGERWFDETRNKALTNIVSASFYKVIPSSILQDSTALTDVTINLTASTAYTQVGNMAFVGCSNLTSVTMSNIDRIMGNAFKNTGLVNVTIPEGCTQISNYAFMGCASLTSVVIPSTVGAFSNGLFSGCTSLSSITVNNMTAPTASFGGANISPTGVLYVPTGATGYDDWLTTLGEGWSISYITP